MRKALSAATIFLGSFLLFGVQPMVGRTLLPYFGGTAAVWIVCLCAFQAMLPAGYLYAHVMASRRRTGTLHVGLLLAAAALTVLVASKRHLLTSLFSTGVPALDVLWCVTALAGLSYVFLSANVSLVSSSAEGRDVYRLYAVSNAGSLTGLLAYPFFVEPFLGVTTQWMAFAAGIAIYAVLMAMQLRIGKASAATGASMSDDNNKSPVSSAATSGMAASVLWVLLPASSCFLLNALTTHVTTDIMPLPLVWTMTLSLFLLSYIVGFSGIAERLVRIFACCAVVCGLSLVWLSGAHKVWGREINFKWILAACAGFLFFGCAFLHAWLYKVRPEASRLTRYYLYGAVGGGIGGLMSGLVFPMISNDIVEFPLALVTVAVLTLIACRKLRWQFLFVLVVVLAGTGIYVSYANAQSERPLVFAARGFFGSVKVTEAKARVKAGEGVIREYVHGTTVHGIQALLPGRDRMPTTYYTPNGCGYAIAAHPKYRRGVPMRVCLVGLGLGVSYSYARTGDYYRGYEIADEVMGMATNTNLFTFISGCPAQHDEILDDARKGLEREQANGEEAYDVILVDAFSGDSQPYHISTREAFELYFNRLKPDGVLAVNISNRHLGLEPFMKTIGETFNVPLLGLECLDAFPLLQFSTKAAFFCRKPEGLSDPPEGTRMIDFRRFRIMKQLPTDEKGSFISLVRW